ncbi:MAG: hypothetical protein J7K21_02270 [Desulfurococcales archaeon]|nr:hypothetical protein [Desulfurococcales archaeon]
MRCEKVLSYSKYRCSGLKNAGYAARVLRAYPVLIMLLRRLPAYNTFVVKPRDACRYLGLCSHHILTSLGLLLSVLSRMGLATRLNNSRPVHYALDPMVFLRYLDTCRIERGEDYCIDTGCSGLGVCPYWRLKVFLLRGGRI